MTETKTCTKCKETKTLDLFVTLKGKPGSWCKKCNSENAKANYRRKNPNAKDMSIYELKYGKRDDPDYLRKWNWYNNYNLTPEKIEYILTVQANKCPVCLSEFSEENRFYVDHDHTCCSGKKSCGDCVRGFLCNTCNSALGKLQDNTETLHRAITYLEVNPFYDRRRS
jgi:hypothetical protein